MDTKCKIFISWSGESGKQIASKLKEVLEEDVFTGKISCFVSDTDIASGEDWWNKIKEELTTSKLGILCITKENTKAPWIYFEAGAMVGNDIHTIPLLFNCELSVLDRTPLNHSQSVTFHDLKKFQQMILHINNEFKLLDYPKKQIEAISLAAYKKIKKDLSKIFATLKNQGYFNDDYIYPKEIKIIQRNTVFLSAPMNTLKAEEYKRQWQELKKIRDALGNIGYRNVICPALDIEDPRHFDGTTKAVKSNFKNLKRSESFILVYLQSKATSSLIELGYAIATGKRVVVFYKNQIPYLLQKAGENIAHVRTLKCNSYSDIVSEIVNNKMALFEKK